MMYVARPEPSDSIMVKRPMVKVRRRRRVCAGVPADPPSGPPPGAEPPKVCDSRHHPDIVFFNEFRRLPNPLPYSPSPLRFSTRETDAIKSQCGALATSVNRSSRGAFRYADAEDAIPGLAG
jgi:hypothetical protein